MIPEENETETKAPEPSFAPPIKITVHTNNLSKCELRIAGADGVAIAIEVPSDGNVYQGLHRARGPLEDAFNRVLAKHNVVPPPAPVGEPAAEDTPTS